MAITTVDGIIAGAVVPPRLFFKGISNNPVVGKPMSTWALGGIPGAGSFDTTLNGVTLSSTGGMINGQIPFTDPAGGVNSYLGRAIGLQTNGGVLWVLDRLWHNGGITAVTSAQAIVSPAWPSRDNNGATNGEGVFVGLEFNATGAANTPVVTLNYTNSAGVAGRTAVLAVNINSSPVAQSFYVFGLQAGDLGVRSVQSVTFSIAPTAGTCNLVAFRILAQIECPTLGAFAIDPITGAMPQLFNGTVPYIANIPASTTSGIVSGSINILRG